MMLFDSHCHLNFADFDQDRDLVIERALTSGITSICIPGTRFSEWPELLKLIDKTNATTGLTMVTALGLHPYFISEHTPEHIECLDHRLKKRSESVVAIGETGLDFFDKKLSPVTIIKQVELFTAHVHLASKYHLPLIIHSRKSYDSVLKILRQCKPERGGIIHAFSGSEQQAMQFIELGFGLGFGGGITYPRASKTRNLAATLPIDCIMLETDAPNMPLNGFQGERNEPSRVLMVAEVLAELRGISLEEVAKTTSENCQRIFIPNGFQVATKSLNPREST